MLPSPMAWRSRWLPARVLTMNADGKFDYDPNGKFEDLLTGIRRQQPDGHGQFYLHACRRRHGHRNRHGLGPGQRQ